MKRVKNGFKSVKNGLICIMLLLSIIVTGIEGKEQAFVESSTTSYGEEVIHMYTHRGSGLKVVWIENEDKNKSFTLGVKTPTSDSTGVNHIIEHALFTGSKKYPSSTLFFDASSQYPHLFMNAMTTSDLTLYPFCTPYDSCFKALIEIYLDSILNPNMLEQAHSFYEESFHYNPVSEKMGGVVYNEMKGASTDPNRALFRLIRKAFYSGTHYENDSGGSVCAIPTLTYQQFVDTYKKYYYPANMYIVLYGKFPIEETLETIDGYVKDFPLTDKQIEVNVPESKIMPKQTLYYDAEEGANYIVKAFRFKEMPSVEEQMNMDLWLSTYVIDEKSDFMQQLQVKGIKEVQVIKDGDLEKPAYAITLTNVKKEDIPYLEEVLNAAFKELLVVEEDKEREKDLLAKERMRYQEINTIPTRGIQLGEMYIDEWSHEKPSHTYYKQMAYMNELKDIPDCRKMLFEHMEYTLLRIHPNGEAAVCEPIKDSSVPKEDWMEIVKEMDLWQQASKHQKLDAISLDKLIIKPSILPKVTKTNDITYMLSASKNIPMTYRLYLPTGYIEQESLPYLFLYGQFLEKAASEISPYLGDVKVEIMAVDKEKECIPYLKITLLPLEDGDPRILWDTVQKAMAEKDEVWYRRQINGFITRFKENFTTDLLGTLRMLSKNSQSGAKRYLFEAEYPLYAFCKSITSDNYKEVVNTIKGMGSKLFFTDQAAIGMVGPKEKLEAEKMKWEAYIVQHKLDNVSYNKYDLIKNKKTNLYYKDSPVDYLLCSYDKGQDLIDGKDYVVAAYLTSYYLQPTIRVQRGAYGAGMHAIYPNTLSIYTYRDPDYKNSIEAIDKMIPYVREGLDKEKLQRAKAEALSQMQRQFKLLDNDKVQTAWFEHLILSGIDLGCINKLQQEIIHTTCKSLDEKLALTAHLIDQSHINLCTNPKRMKKN